MKCHNCSNEFPEQAQYCPCCGQSRKDFNRPFKQLISESLYELLDIDGRLTTTLKTLLFQPGNLTTNYRAGKRVSFTPPLRMYLITSLLLFFIMSMIKTDYSEGKELISFLILPSGVLEQIPKIIFVLLPFYASVLQMTQPSSRYIFNLVFAVHIHTFWYLLFIFFLLLQSFSNYLPDIGYVGLVVLVYFLIYQLIAIKRFYQVSWIKSFLINLFTLGIYLAAISLVLEIVTEILKTF